jgi:hypothetical protein
MTSEMTPKLFIAIPSYNGVPVDFLQCLMRLQADPPCSLEIKFMPGDSLVCRARNTLTAAFLKSDCTHLMFIDSDLIFSGEQIKRLLDDDKDVVGGFYPKKKEGPLEWVCNGKAGCLTPGPDGLYELRYTGTGFMLIRRSVIEKMIAVYGEQIAYHPDNAPEQVEYDLWPVGPYKNKETGFTRYLSEDWYFCQRWLDLGGQVFGDSRVPLKHIGQATYPLNSQMAELTASR